MRKQLLHVAAVLLAVVGTTTAFGGDFTAYEGKDAIQEGQGGAKKTVDGIDFWSNGAPPRKFKLLGFIDDRRQKTGLIGMARMSGLESSIAKQAKKVGGDAVILVDSHADTVGTVGQSQTFGQASANSYGNTTTARGNAWGSGSTVAVQKQQSRFAVVKYLADEADDAKSEESPPN